MSGLQRVERPSDPDRCQAVTHSGQCYNVAATGSRNCLKHHGYDHTNDNAVQGYLIANATDRARLAQVSDGLEPVKELRDSIGLLHMMIEKRWGMIKNDGDLLQACGPLNTMLQNMDRLVNSCHKIEQNLGQLLAKQAIMGLAKGMVAVLIEELQGIDNYEETIDRITERLIAMVKDTDNAELEAVKPRRPPPTVATPGPGDMAKAEQPANDSPAKAT